MSTTLQVRVDKKIKQKAQKVFKNMGLDMSSGVKLYLAHVVNTGSLPFTPKTANGFTEEQERQIMQETERILKSGKKGYKSATELFRALDLEKGE